MPQEDKVGSSPEAADAVVKEDDFGVHESDRTEREYASQQTRREDKGAGVERSGTGSRDSGVGGNDSGPGSSSGGDIDVGGTALTGVGDKNTQAPVGEQQQTELPDRKPLDPPVINDDPARAGHTDSDASTSAADVTNETHRDGNAFKGDVTADEASGNSSK